MSVSTPLLDTIEPDETPVELSGNISSAKINSNARKPVVLTPTNRAQGSQMATTQSDAESALVFNVANAVGFTYADRDAKQRWANSVVGGGWGLGSLGGQLITGAVQKGVGRMFG
ncbi:hypothetical protein HHX47_DHR1001673 [Lentinula edodes]|nr:hypothetical protein HHX47_DHR1001673 [Lentinula edodes]